MEWGKGGRRGLGGGSMRHGLTGMDAPILIGFDSWREQPAFINRTFLIGLS